jgi:hypothetical protein
MSEAEILELTYDCTCKIIRKVSVKDVDTGITSNTDVVIANNIKCAISKLDKMSSSINGEIGSIISNDTLFINPLADVLPGDTLEVTNEIGEKTIYLASKPKYYKSHKNIPVTEKDRV